jgi:hypothetical protein
MLTIFRVLYPIALVLFSSVAHSEFFRIAPAQPLAGQDLLLELDFLAGSSCSHGSPARADVVNNEIIIRLPAPRAGVMCAQVVVRYQQSLRISGAQLAAPGTYPVKLIAENGLGANKDRDLKFGLISVANDASTIKIRPESGAWTGDAAGRFPSSGSGTGFSLELQNDVMLVNLSVYDRDGRPRWLLASGKMQGNVFNGELSQVNNGQELLGPYKMPSVQFAIADIAIDFVSPTEATVYSFGRPEQSFQPEILTRSTFTRLNFGHGDNKRGLAGKWVYVLDNKIAQSEPLELQATGDNGAYLNIGGVFALLCDAQVRGQLLPQACQLRKLNVLQEAVFDQVSYNRLRGKNSQGQAVSLIRLD